MLVMLMTDTDIKISNGMHRKTCILEIYNLQKVLNGNILPPKRTELRIRLVEDGKRA